MAHGSGSKKGITRRLQSVVRRGYSYSLNHDLLNERITIANSPPQERPYSSRFVRPLFKPLSKWNKRTETPCTTSCLS